MIGFPAPPHYLMADGMVHSVRYAALLVLLICVGCDSRSPVVGHPQDAANGDRVANAQGNDPSESSLQGTRSSDPSRAGEPSPTEIVSQFLDQVRRGGDKSEAGNLLTKIAQAELTRIGRSIEPIGSPDARFQVTRAENVPGEEGAALVHSIWSEPAADGGQADFQVVWAVSHEEAGWRISGLAMEMNPNQAPLIIDFENGELMAKILGATSKPEGNPAKTASDVTSQANGPDAPLSR